MYPIVLDLSKAAILLIGHGEPFAKRKAQLEAAGASKLLTRGSFNAYDLEAVSVVMVAGLSNEESAHIAAAAREEHKLVNVEDVSELCDFIFTAHIMRGDLLIAVSTGGASPTLAKRVRDVISQRFDEKWTGYTQLIKEFRDSLRAQGKTMKEVAAASEKFIEEKGWLRP
jgi:precorrin-2 dehydrogenase/sirohydrochlorin ferrochelatase